MQRASSVALTTDGAGTHTGESYVAVTGHWIDRIPTPTHSTWKMVSAVLAVSIDNGNKQKYIYNVHELLDNSISLPSCRFLIMTPEILSIRNSSQRLEHLKKLQIEENQQAACMKLISDGNRVVILRTFYSTMPHLCFFTDVTLNPDEFMHSKASTVIKDIVTRWNSTLYMLERCIKLKPYIQEVCTEYNLHPIPTEQQWDSAHKLVCFYDSIPV